MHRGAFCQFPFRLIYYCHSSSKETGKTNLYAKLTSDCRYIFTWDSEVWEVSIVLVLILCQTPGNAEWTDMKLTTFFTLNNDFLYHNFFHSKWKNSSWKKKVANLFENFGIFTWDKSRDSKVSKHHQRIILDSKSYNRIIFISSNLVPWELEKLSSVVSTPLLTIE